MPKTQSVKNKTKIEEVLKKIVESNGENERYFILTNKKLKLEIETFLSETYPESYFIIEYFGNLRGVNTARKCNIGIILGSLILPDTIEIAMAFDFIQENLKSELPYPIKVLGNIWSWQGSIGVKKYKEKFLEIENFSRMYRYSEYRQAIARTRYLFHAVNFYIFSKDEISTYEPFVSEIKELQYSDDLFPPSSKRSDNQELAIEDSVNEWLNKPDNHYITATILYNEYGIRRQTAGKHLKKMLKEGKLTLIQEYKKRYCKKILVC